ncbi:MAG: helix-turn-helix domain-containing protein [Lachnospiraceae bacterium]|nr:helix-turn-helix domain-containing protein [Lachnospiraceae bacterium]
MTFSEKLNEYIDTFGINYTQLAKTAGMSVSAISRYAKGEREPRPDSKQIEQISKGLVLLANEKGIEITPEEILFSLQSTIKNTINIEYDAYLSNLNSLLKSLDIRISSLAKTLSYDPSYISKILSGSRRPSNITAFNSDVASYIIKHYTKGNEIEYIINLTNSSKDSVTDQRILQRAITTWLGSNNSTKTDEPIAHFLEKVDSFNLDDYIQSIHFDDIKLPSSPFQLPTTKTYKGLTEMMESELDFIKATVLSKSMDDCILYSDMPMDEMANEPDFPKKWMFGRAMMLKKGLHLHIIHDINRPFNEMMLGLESQIPMYMTGQISPYYLASSQSNTFMHLLNVSGAAALEGHAIAGHHSTGKYTLYKSKEDIKYYRIKAGQLLQKALPLMDIYRSDKKTEYLLHLHKLWNEGDRQVFHCSLPIYTMSEKLLDSILTRNHISKENAKMIKNFRKEYRTAVIQLLKNYKAHLVIPNPTPTQFEDFPLNLSLSELFFASDIPYHYEEYRAHLEETKIFANQYSNLTLELDPIPAFRNLTYSIIDNKQVIVSKNKFPTIHFVIHHKRMVQAFKNFLPPLRDVEK